MENIINNTKPVSGRAVAGLIIIFIGGILLIDQLNLFFIPQWLFSWPMWLIGFGVYLGGKHNFSKPIYGILIILGVLFLITDNINNADEVVWPLAIIGTGLWLVTKPKIRKERNFKEI